MGPRFKDERGLQGVPGAAPVILMSSCVDVPPLTNKLANAVTVRWKQTRHSLSSPCVMLRITHAWV